MCVAPYRPALLVTQRFQRQCALLATLALLGGCEKFNRLRHILKGGDSRANLKIVVEPESAAIQLDGVVVSTRSPYDGKNIPSGEHILSVTAKGYYNFTLPLTLNPGDNLEIPIALREEPAPPPAPAPVPAAPTPPAATLPPGAKPIRVTVATTPAQTAVVMDGAPVGGKKIVFERERGTLSIGGLQLKYRVGGADLLELTLAPSPEASWIRDGEPMNPGTAFWLNPGPSRFSRTRSDGSQEAVVLKRLD